jgi:hypothetical protein
VNTITSRVQVDVLAHVLIVAGLLHQHFHVGPHVSHTLLHAAEGGGLAIAVVSTLAAAMAEVVAMRRSAALAAAADHGGKYVIDPTPTTKAAVVHGAPAGEALNSTAMVTAEVEIPGEAPADTFPAHVEAAQPAASRPAHDELR